MRRKSKSEVAWQQWLEHAKRCGQCCAVQQGKRDTPCPDGEEHRIVHKMWQRVELEQSGRG